MMIHNSHDSEDDFRSGCRNVSHCQQQQFFQNYTNPDDHTQQTTDTPEFKPFTVIYNIVYFIASSIIFMRIVKFNYCKLNQIKIILNIFLIVKTIINNDNIAL